MGVVPNVVSVFDVGTLGARVFIAMEYLPGLAPSISAPLTIHRKVLGPKHWLVGKDLSSKRGSRASYTARSTRPEDALARFRASCE